MGLRRYLPRPMYELLRLLKNRQDVTETVRFISTSNRGLALADRVELVAKLYRAMMTIDCEHTQAEMLLVLGEIFRMPSSVEGVLVEAGCFRGGSTAKLSLAAERTGRLLYAFDSFEGIPPHAEPHGRNIFGGEAAFPPGSYAGTRDEVVRNVTRCGDIASCRVVQGWLEDTLPSFGRPIAFAYLDVDLASSTRTCLKHLFPLLSRGGTIVSQDGHLPLVLDVIQDEAFWRDDVGCPKPDAIEGVGVSKLVWIRKP
jgi:O-methyltransferase